MLDFLVYYISDQLVSTLFSKTNKIWQGLELHIIVVFKQLVSN